MINPIITIVASLVFASLWNNRQLERAIDGVNKRIDDLRSELHLGLEGLQSLLAAELKRIDERLCTFPATIAPQES